MIPTSRSKDKKDEGSVVPNRMESGTPAVSMRIDEPVDLLAYAPT